MALRPAGNQELKAAQWGWGPPRELPLTLPPPPGSHTPGSPWDAETTGLSITKVSQLPFWGPGIVASFAAPRAGVGQEGRNPCHSADPLLQPSAPLQRRAGQRSPRPQVLADYCHWGPNATAQKASRRTGESEKPGSVLEPGVPSCLP